MIKPAFLFGCIMIFFVLQVVGQDKVTLSGYLKDASNGETLIGATIYFPELSIGTTSNVYGFYSISIPIGIYGRRLE